MIPLLTDLPFSPLTELQQPRKHLYIFEYSISGVNGLATTNTLTSRSGLYLSNILCEHICYICCCCLARTHLC
uniref:Uncharacterized protein n=1 Tax=Utricularia reniformis TaxID=192314 RepID=A0A1Y0B4E1_9LAMI|nr:hypothetical protein AEK19_MT2105 [Utricularia reniformis]ART32258.1 hypothetical protein AEK19_MT2105 [Utricularia reniformis]